MSKDAVRPISYLLVFASLMVLTATTVAVSRLELDAWHMAAGMAIAVLKAALVLLFFMHIRFSSPVVRLAALSGLLWVGILLVLSLADYMTRP